MNQTEEEKLDLEIRDVYNSGDCKKAIEMACAFLEKYPESFLAKYDYAVMHGDYSVTPGLSAEEKQRLLAIAKKGVSELFHDPRLAQWPSRFQKAVRNEYYWFFELPEEQYKLGIEEVNAGENGHYSACVGASMLALKMLKESKIKLAEEWAQKSLIHFSEFEKLDPDWYNINYFAAQALACLGLYEEAMTCFCGMYRKQQSSQKKGEIDEFSLKIQEIKKLRS